MGRVEGGGSEVWVEEWEVGKGIILSLPRTVRLAILVLRYRKTISGDTLLPNNNPMGTFAYTIYR